MVPALVHSNVRLCGEVEEKEGGREELRDFKRKQLILVCVSLKLVTKHVRRKRRPNTLLSPDLGFNFQPKSDPTQGETSAKYPSRLSSPQV